ncbi:MAG: hypothetical protein K5641_06250 [Lachnospiraceae bacterium]|nr:hypothetical protein [Lachnospiraceae bacterium]
MTNPNDLPQKKKRKKRKKTKKQNFLHFLPHILFFAAVIIIVTIGIIKLSAWNKGIKSDYDPNATNTGFDSETMDYYSALSPDQEAKQKDDGVNSILVMGNNVLAKWRGESDGITALIEKYSGGKVYDLSVDRSYISVKNFPFEEDHPADVFSFYWMANCLANNDLTLLRDYSKVFGGDDHIGDVIATAESIDMSAIDTLVVFYDHHDYEDKRLLQRIHVNDNERLTDSCVECLRQGIQLIQTNYPQIRIIVVSPYYNFIEVDGKLVPSGETELVESTELAQYGTLSDYLVAYMNTVAELGCSFVDNYIGTINADNYKEYLDDELKYPNAEGRDLIARRIAKFINPEAE